MYIIYVYMLAHDLSSSRYILFYIYIYIHINITVCIENWTSRDRPYEYDVYSHIFL